MYFPTGEVGSGKFPYINNRELNNVIRLTATFRNYSYSQMMPFVALYYVYQCWLFSCCIS